MKIKFELKNEWNQMIGTILKKIQKIKTKIDEKSKEWEPNKIKW
jgi:hypothetical protein